MAGVIPRNTTRGISIPRAPLGNPADASENTHTAPPVKLLCAICRGEMTNSKWP